LSYASSDVPLGINLPNYEDIREKYGYKNLNLVNAKSQMTPDAVILYLHEADQALFIKYIDEVDQMNVALHELFGHGTGKLLTRDPVTGALNYPPDLINPLTGSKVDNPYSTTESPN
jgi:dipeptidyl-peptidase-3